MPTESESSAPIGSTTLLVLALVVFTAIFVRNAWVVDDAYITFRTVDHFLAGHGLVWNLGERVQAYSHPFWMFLVSAGAALSGDVFYTSLALSYGLCLASFLWLWRRTRGEADSFRPPLFVLCVIASKAVVDYSSSGLENPLSYLLATLFVCAYLRPLPQREGELEKQTGFLFGVAALAFFNRQDTLLLYLPALLQWLAAVPAGSRARVARVVLLATLPATGWLLFSLFYYGSPVPNTALAKAFGPGVPFAEKFLRGLEYAANSLRWDTASHLAILAALAVAGMRRNTRSSWLLGGVGVYFVYVVCSAAAATHMSGRFFALPIWVSLLVLVSLLPSARSAALVAALAVLALVANPHSPLRMGTSTYADVPQDLDHIDTNWFVHREGAALIDFFERDSLPDHEWYHAGLAFRDRDEVVAVGAEGGAAIGYFAYAAGPSKIIIDYAALSDPLLARLAACNTRPAGSWRSGHFFRSLPAGYIASMESGENDIEDPGLHDYYGKIRSVTRGPLFDLERLGDVLWLNLGAFESLKSEYERAAAGSCRIPTRRSRG